MKYYALMIALLLTACDNRTVTDQCLRVEIFKDCLATVPAGPLATKYNDWDEVIVECRHTAYYMAQRQRSFVKEECRGN